MQNLNQEPPEPLVGGSGGDPLKLKHCYILMRKFIFKFWHGFKNVYLKVVIQYLNLKALVKGQPPEAEVLLHFAVANIFNILAWF